MARLPQVGGDTGNWGEILNEYLSQSLSSNGSLNIETVGNPQLKNGAVSSFKLADTAVTSNKLAPGAVTTSHIADGAIGQHQLADNAITPAKLRNPGQANGVALLDSNAKIAEVQLPSRLGVGELTSSIVNVSGYSTHERKIESFLLPGEHFYFG